MKKEKNKKQNEESPEKKDGAKETEVNEVLEVSKMDVPENIKDMDEDESLSDNVEPKKKKGFEVFKVIKTILLSSILAVLCYSSYKIYNAVSFASGIEDRIEVVSAKIDDLKNKQNELHKKILDVEENGLKNVSSLNGFKREIDSFKKEVSDNSLYLETTKNIVEGEDKNLSSESFDSSEKKSEPTVKNENRNKRFDEGVNNFLDILDGIMGKVKGAFLYVWGKIKK